jgi:hypothetical protein
MKLTKDFLRSLIIEEMNKQLNEATDEEIGHLNDVLEMPKSALPFHDIFGDRYRILSSYKANDPRSPFSQFERFLARTGWRFNPDNMGEVIKSITSSYIANPEDGVQHRTKEEKMSITKWMQDLNKYLNSVSQTMDGWQKTVSDMKEYAEKNFSDGKPVPSYRRASGFKPEYLKDKNYLNMFRKRLALKKSIMKFLPAEASMRIFADISRVRWGRGEETDNDVEDFFKLSNLKAGAAKQQKWLMGSKGSGAKNYEILDGKSMDEYKAEQGETEYVVFSRHPIDVFRMSDHAGLNSCHSLPSSDEKGNLSRYDEYNICALAEAHANGMIAYALNPDDFEEPPTQDLLDQYEDEEFFSDDDRGVDGFSPVGRIRIKNVGFLADKGDYSEILTRVAVPEKRSYGDTIPGFVEHVNKVLARTQRTKIQDIVDKFNGNVDLRRFLRVGGSYEDNSMTQMIPEFFGQVLDREDLEFEQTVQYSNDLEQSLKDQYQGMTIVEAREKLQDLIQEYNSGYVRFDDLVVEEDWNGNGFYMSGQVKVIYPYADEIEYVGGNQDVSELMQEAFDQADDLYFYDDSWTVNAELVFDSSWGGYQNVMIISFYSSNYHSEHNEEYYPYDPDTWMYALSDIADRLNTVMDPHAEDSLNNYIKEHISYHGEATTVRTDISSKFYMTRFKDALEEDSNWNIDDEEVDEDNAMGLEIIRSFTAEFSEDVWLQDLFDSVNESFDPDNPELVEMAKRLSNHIATLTSMLSSEGMNILKAGLIHEEFYNNQNLYSGLSGATKLNELDMEVSIEVNRDPDISPEKIFQAIIDNEGYSVTIKITCEDWDAATIETVGKMMLGEFNDNNGWHIDAEECMEALVRADIQTITQPREPEGLQEIIRKEVLKLLQAR